MISKRKGIKFRVESGIEGQRKLRAGIRDPDFEIERIRERAYFKPEFLRLPEKERDQILRRQARTVEIVKERTDNLYDFLNSRFIASRPGNRLKLSEKEESFVLEQLRKIDSGSVRVLNQMNKVFVPKKELQKYTSLDAPYPLAQIHQLFFSEAQPKNLKKLQFLIECCKHCKILSEGFKPPWG